MIRFLFACILFSLSTVPIPAQNNYTSLHFLDLEENRFHNINRAENADGLLRKLALVCKGETQPISVLHIGDSHLQAGFYSNEIRQNLQNYFSSGTTGSFGILFPFQVAKTNNPGNYAIQSTGEWESCKAVDQKPTCRIGLTGITVMTKDSTASLSLQMKKYFPVTNYSFDKVRIFYEDPDSAYQLQIRPKGKIQKDSAGIIVSLEHKTDSFQLKMIKKSQHADSSHFYFYGFNVQNKRSLFTYHSVGVNGAKAKSYLRCQHLPQQLEALQPDWVIISLGTNEAYNKNYDQEEFRRHLSALIDRIREHAENTFILLNTPGDGLIKGKSKNLNNLKARDDIIALARKKKCAWWDFYNIMGGEGSIDAWFQHELTARDRLHLNKKGYRLKGNLFFDAFEEIFNPYLNKTLKDN